MLKGRSPISLRVCSRRSGSTWTSPPRRNRPPMLLKNRPGSNPERELKSASLPPRGGSVASSLWAFLETQASVHGEGSSDNSDAPRRAAVEGSAPTAPDLGHGSFDRPSGIAFGVLPRRFLALWISSWQTRSGSQPDSSLRQAQPHSWPEGLKSPPDGCRVAFEAVPVAKSRLGSSPGSRMSAGMVRHRDAAAQSSWRATPFVRGRTGARLVPSPASTGAEVHPGWAAGRNAGN